MISLQRPPKVAGADCRRIFPAALLRSRRKNPSDAATICEYCQGLTAGGFRPGTVEQRFAAAPRRRTTASDLVPAALFYFKKEKQNG